MSGSAAEQPNRSRHLTWRTVHLFVDPAPGRLYTALLLTGAVVVIATVWELFRLPESGVACSLVFFAARGERASATAAAGAMVVLATLGVVGALLVTMATLAEPALRITLMAALTFVTMFLSRAVRGGQAFFAAGFIMVYASTMADSMYRLALSPDVVGDVAGAGVPGILSMPPEEALTHMLMWVGLAFTAPNLLVLLLNKAFGLDPAALLRAGLDQRLRVAEAWLRGGPAAALEAAARRGSAELLALAASATKEHGAWEPLGSNQAAVRAITRLLLACVAAEQAGAGTDGPAWRAEAARRCAALRCGEAAGPEASVEDPIGREALRALDGYAQALTDGARPHSAAAAKAAGLWRPDAWRPANWQFALKVTLAVMTCYVLYNALDWPGISTCLVTAFLVSLSSVGESGHKMTMRLGGCLLGAAMGIGAILLLMPLMTDIGQLLLLVAAGAFVAAWVICGSQRISYTGLQISLAFFLTILQDYGPTLNMETARNRVAGILLGNVVTYLALATFWPERVERLVAAKLAESFSALACLLRRSGASDATEDEARERFGAAIAQAQTLLLDTLYEGAPPDQVVLDEETAKRVQALIIPVSMIAARGPESDRARLAAWLDTVAERLHRGVLRRDGFPPPPSLDGGGRGQALLAREIRNVLG